MHRCLVLVAMAAGLVLFASGAGAEEPLHRIGFLSAQGTPEVMNAWRQGLGEHGYADGRNLQIEYRFFEGRSEQLPALVAELVALGPEIIVTGTPQPALAVRAAAPTIPLVFVNVPDPVGLGLVESLAHPGGNATGVAWNVSEGFAGKRIQLLKDLVPRASRIAVLLDPVNPMRQYFRAETPETIERLLGVRLLIVEVDRPDQYEAAFKGASKEGAEAIDVVASPSTFVHSAKVVALASRYRLPAIYGFRRSALDGGLLSFGVNLSDNWRRAGAYVDKILKGERPADLPVEQPTGYQLVVNLKTAAALGITVPPLILARADEVIE
jgi:putative tryptophan/tyrosine transport system substrate-binding protein